MVAGGLQCELSWSASRAKEFDRCRREYWYARYASWGWWNERPRGRKWEAMVHKNLVSLPAFVGSCVHEAIQGWFGLRDQGVVQNGKQLFEAARERFRDGWRESRNGLWGRRPNKSVHLEEHHYGVPLPPGRTDAARDLLERCAHAFAEGPALAPVRESPTESHLALESLETWELDGVAVYSVPDLALREGGRVRIFDWKTGRPREEDEFQLRTYALFARHKWGVEPEEVDLLAVYLAGGGISHVPVDAESLEGTRERVRASMGSMVEVHYDPDREEADLARWPMNGAPDLCPRCRFRGICEGPHRARAAELPAAEPAAPDPGKREPGLFDQQR